MAQCTFIATLSISVSQVSALHQHCMLSLLQDDPDLYQQYHEGFRQQTAGWPRQPVDVAIDWLRGKPAGWRVADFGCGDARLARTVQQVLDSVRSSPGCRVGVTGTWFCTWL